MSDDKRAGEHCHCGHLKTDHDKYGCIHGVLRDKCDCSAIRVS